MFPERRALRRYVADTKMFQWLKALWARWFAPPPAPIAERLYLFPTEWRPLLQNIRDTDLLNVLLETQERVKELCPDVRYDDFIMAPVVVAMSTGTPPPMEWVRSVSREQGVPERAAKAVRSLCTAWAIAQEGSAEQAKPFCNMAVYYADGHASYRESQ